MNGSLRHQRPVPTVIGGVGGVGFSALYQLYLGVRCLP